MILMLCAACFLQQTLYPYVSFVVECASSLLAMFARQSMTVFLTLLKLMRPSVLLKSFLGAVIMLPTVPVVWHQLEMMGRWEGLFRLMLALFLYLSVMSFVVE